MFSVPHATRVLNFFELVLKHPRKKERPPFLLLNWQVEILSKIFGTIDPETRLREIRRVYIEIAKKNGKSELAAGIALYMLLADNEPGAEVYSAATTKEQAAIVFKTAAAMVDASPLLRRKLRVIRSTKTIVKRDDVDSFYKAISADGGAQDGINPHCVIIDELHRWRTTGHAELFDVLTKGTVARDQPLVFEITTAGSTEDESPLAWSEHEYTLMLHDGTLTDKSFAGWIFAAGKDDDWTLPSTWAKANPSLELHPGGFLKLETMRSEFDKALGQPRRRPAFERYHLGRWLSSDEEWMPPSLWDQGSAELRALIERPCYAGLDLSSLTDLTSLALLFPADDDTFDLKVFFWMAKDNVRERELADRVPYGTWAKDGYLETPEGDVIDTRAVKKMLAWASEMFELREVAFDPHHALQFATELTDEMGLKCVPVPPRYSHFSEPMKAVMNAAKNKLIRHGGNPILKWNMRCLRVREDDNDSIRPVKPKRFSQSKRIDGAVASIMAMSRAMFHPKSAYERRGLSTL